MEENTNTTTESQTVKTDYKKLATAIKRNWFLMVILINFAVNMAMSAWEMYNKDFANACGSLMMANISALFVIHLAVEKNDV